MKGRLFVVVAVGEVVFGRREGLRREGGGRWWVHGGSVEVFEVVLGVGATIVEAVGVGGFEGRVLLMEEQQEDETVFVRDLLLLLLLLLLWWWR